MTSGQQEKLQLLREERLGANLKALLRRWVEGDQTGFRVSAEGLAVGPNPRMRSNPIMYIMLQSLDGCSDACNSCHYRAYDPNPKCT